MPWIIKTHVTFGIIIILFYVYFYFHLRSSLKNIGEGKPAGYVKYVLPVLIYLNLMPFLALAVYLINPSLASAAVAGYVRKFDYYFMVPYWLGFAFIGQMFLLMAVMDLSRLLLYPVYRKHRTPWMRGKSYIFLGAATFLVAYVPVKTYYDTNTVRLSSFEYAIAGLPEELHGFRIAHISDIHADPRTAEKKLNRYIAKINQTHPHIILHAGDIVTSGQRFIEIGARHLGSAKAEYGIFSCVGDHDYWSGSDSIRTAFADHGVIYRDNKNEFVNVNGALVGISIVTDIYSRRISESKLDSLALDVSRADLRIILSHQVPMPLVERAEERGYQIFLAGHTHGGQVVFGIPGLVPIQGSRIETPYVSGFFDLGSKLVSVNNGLGLTLAPIRFQAPAEVSLITLKRAGD